MEPIFGDSVPNIENFRGKPLLILIFNLGCAGCKGRAIPFANRMVYELGDQLNVIGIHSNFEGLPIPDDELKAVKEEFYIRFPYYKDYRQNNTYYKYHALGTPHWLLADSMGRQIYAIFGSDPNNALLRLDLKIKELLT